MGANTTTPQPLAAIDQKIQVTYCDIGDLKPYPRNARTHSKSQVTQIAKSIAEFGWTNPVLIDEERNVLAGHGRIEAALELGITSIPTISVRDLSSAQKRAYILADNKIADNAGWDDGILALEFADLYAFDADLDLTVTGFAVPEIDLLIQSLGDTQDSQDDEEGLSIPDTPITKDGDVWQIGDHRIGCGDVRNRDFLDRLMAGNMAQMVFTDPPYNVAIAGNVSGKGKLVHEDFAVASGELSSAEFEAFLSVALANLRAVSTSSSLHYVCMDWRHMSELLSVGKSVYTQLLNLCVWNKTNGGMGGFYRSKHELVFVLKTGKGAHINNVELGKHGRNRSNVWDYPGASAFGESRASDLAAHPTVKPTSLVADALLDASHRGDIVLDGFLGSGTTVLAAAQTGRIGYGLEIDPAYVDVAVERVQKATDLQAVHTESGLTFSSLKAGGQL